MPPFAAPALSIYAVFATVLCVLLFAIDAFGGVFRARTRTTPNVEDAASDFFVGSKGDAWKVGADDPEGVARVARAHRNAMSNIVPFLIVTGIYAALGATTAWVAALCGVYTAMRFTHAIVYIRGIQPWRTISFVVGQIAFFVAVVQAARTALAVM